MRANPLSQRYANANFHLQVIHVGVVHEPIPS